eukprot:1030448_1
MASSMFVLIMVATTAMTASRTTHPNILFILADDLGWGNIGYNSPSNTEIRTPNINHLARKEGLILNRHYVHYCCSPTRTSFQSGRLPVHVNLNNNDAASNPYSGAPIHMTMIAEKLKNSPINYNTHFIGKWDAGSTTTHQLPINRGYDTSFGYLSHANTYYTNYEWSHPCQDNIYDLWESDAPAYNEVNDDIFEEFKFADRVYNLIDNYDNSSTENPFFIVYASHLAHDPLQMDEDYYEIFDNDESNCSAKDPYIYPGFNGTFHCRSVVQSMVNVLDIIIGNITQKLKYRHLWQDTLVVFSGDNGGCQRLDICGGNNHPLRGGKFVPFEGGIRTASFVSGGYEQIVDGMSARLVELKQGYYSNNESGTDICPKGINMTCACWVAKNKYNGFYGPYQTVGDTV